MKSYTARRSLSAFRWAPTQGPMILSPVPIPIVTCLALCGGTLAAQNETAPEVAQRTWVAVQDHKWDAVAHLTHPRALREFRALLAPIVDADGPAADSVRQIMFGSISHEAAAMVSDSAVYVNLMRWSDSLNAAQPGAMEATHYQLLGTVAEGRDTVHVIARASATVSGRHLTWIQVYSLARSGATWRGLLQPNWSQFAAALRAAITHQQ